MEQFADWVSMVNVNLADHEARMRVLEQGNGQDVDFDDSEYAMPGESLRQVQQYDIRTSPERQASRLDSHDPRMRVIEHRLLSIEISIRELIDALKSTGRV